jgi:phosphoglucomutase
LDESEKDGLWAALAWMSIVMKANENVQAGSQLLSVKDIVRRHWEKYGRHFYCRYDYENVDSEAANKVIELIRNEFVGMSINTVEDEEIKLLNAEEFA